MGFLELAKQRYSVRKYQSKVVEEAKLRTVLEAGRVAPSAVNFQPLNFIVIQEEDMRQKIATTYSRDWLLQAPVIIVICGDHNKAWRRADGKGHCDIDAAIAIDHMTLAATDLGLGTCWICAFNAMQCSKILNLPSHIEPIALLPLGYPDDTTDSNRHNDKRKSFDQIVHWNSFQRGDK